MYYHFICCYARIYIAFLLTVNDLIYFMARVDLVSQLKTSNMGMFALNLFIETFDGNIKNDFL